MRSRRPIDVDRRAQGGEARGLKALRLDDRQDLGKQIQIVRWIFHSVHNGANAPADGEREYSFDRANGQQRKARIEVDKFGRNPPNDGGEGDQGQRQSQRSHPHGEGTRGFACPLRQSFGINPRAEVVARNGDLFAEIE